jgi:hypothetical protein
MMKAINKQLTATMITLLISCSMLFANTTGVTVHVLSDNEWQSIEDSAEMEAILDITDMPALRDNGLHVLTDQEWEAIRTEVELAGMLELDNTPTNNWLIAPTLTEAEWGEIKAEAELEALLDF